jgi:hypothetical protein
MSTIKSRHIWILYLLLAAVVLPIHGQNAPGSNIVSKTFLSADETKAIEQRVYDNGLGDILQEVQSYPGSTLPSVIVHHAIKPVPLIEKGRMVCKTKYQL